MTRRAPTINIDRALLDPHLLGAAIGNPASWSIWLAILRAAFALAMSDEDLAALTKVAGDRKPPNKRVRELWCLIGRRSGKSRIAAALAVFIACFVKHHLARGEVGTVLVLAASQAQAKVVFDYCLGYLTASPVLKSEIAATTTTEIRLRNGNVIAVHPNSYRTVRCCRVWSPRTAC